jgi:hypothetical protein
LQKTFLNGAVCWFGSTGFAKQEVSLAKQETKFSKTGS